MTTTSRTPLARALDWGFEGSAWLLLAITPILINVYNNDAYRTIQATFTSILLTVGLACWAIARSNSRTWLEVRQVPLLVPLGVFLGWAALTVVRNPSPMLGMSSWWNLLMYTGYFVALADSAARDPQLKWRLLGPLSFGVLANSVVGILQYRHFPFMELFKQLPANSNVGNYFAGLDAPSKIGLDLGNPGSAAGMLGNQNVLGNYLAGVLGLTFLVGVGALFDRKRWDLGLSMLITGGLATAALIATMTRGAWIGAIFGLVYAAVLVIASYRETLKRLNPRVWIVVGAVVVALGGVLAWQGNTIGMGRAITKLENIGKDSTSQQRVHAWHVAKTMADEKPLMGQGLATYKVLYFRYLEKTFRGQGIPEVMHHRYVQAHNDYVQLAGECGYVGLLLGLVVFGGFAGSLGWWLIRHPELPHLDRLMAIGGAAGFVGIAGTAVFGFPYHIASSSMLSTICAGLAMAPMVAQRRAAAPVAPQLYSDIQLAIYQYALPVAIAFMAVAVSLSFWSPYQADMAIKQGNELYKLQRLQESQAAFADGIRLDPERGDAHLMLGLISAVTGRFPDAEREFVEATRTYDDVTLHYYLGRVYEELKAPDKARQQYEHAINYFPVGTEISNAVRERLVAMGATVSHTGTVSVPVQATGSRK